jgi:hypothetical protein
LQFGRQGIPGAGVPDFARRPGALDYRTNNHVEARLFPIRYRKNLATIFY